MSTISSDGRYVHLWDLLTDVPVGETILAERCERRRELGQRVRNRLNEGARVWGQEMRLSARDEGWELEVFTVFGDDGGRDERTVARLYIPVDKSLPIRVEVPEGEKAEVGVAR